MSARSIWRRVHPDYPAPSDERMARDQRTLNWAAVVLVALSIIPLAIFAVMWASDRDVAHGPRVRAHVDEVLSVRHSSNGPPETSSVRVSFLTEDGRQVSTTLRTTRRKFRDFLELTYDRDDPRTVRALDGPERSWRIPLIIGATMLIMAACFAWFALRIRLGKPSRMYRRSVARFGGSGSDLS
jgi:hypothetical protein